MYTVVVCSNCKHVWIAKDRPKTSECRKCGRTRKFSKLKKYYQDEDLAAAKLARAQVQARVHGQEDRFEEALERGVLHEEIDSVFTQDQYISGQGVDAEEVRKAVGRMLSSPDASKPRREIVRKGIRNQEKPTLEGFIEYAESNGLDASDAVLRLEKLARSGRISLPAGISLSEVEATSQELLESEIDDTRGDLESESDSGSTSYKSKQKAILMNAIGEVGSNPEAVVEYAVNQGMSRENAALRLEKFVRTGESVEIELSDVEGVVAGILGEEPHETSGQKEDSDPAEGTKESNSNPTRGRRNQREIMIDAIRETNNPNRTDVINYASENGISRKKAERFLEKMLQVGDVTESTSGELRLL
ncbi:DUF5817 family protein [Halobacterium wangiae]|uniref:DUF5817 family protein n=1 Tax=Halobacterium wangiae TaxID=2902623 RepID=UPI001E43B8C4|nr:hypothetical protein [Halobacterium wangiae]